MTQLDKKRILLVGGEGYIGNVLTRELLKKNSNIVSFDNLIYRHDSLIEDKKSLNNYKFINASITNINDIKKNLNDVDAVIILAGLVGDPITKKYPKESNLINLLGIKNIIDESIKAKIKKIVFISTCSNYGLIKENEIADEKHILKPLSIYAESKVNIENYLMSLKDKTDCCITILRFATAFGLSERMRFDLTLNEFVRNLYMGNELVVYDSDTWRPYCHVKDFARLIIKVLSSDDDKTNFQIFNAGGDQNNSTKKMLVNKILHYIPSGKVTFQEKGNDPRNYRVNFQKVREILDFEIEYNIDFGITEIINALKENKFSDIEKNINFYGNYEISLDRI